MVVKPRKLSEPMITEPIAPIAPVPQNTRAQINATNSVTSTTTNPSTTGNIPPDLTTMSDHDLISYINPSCFDQGAFHVC